MDFLCFWDDTSTGAGPRASVRRGIRSRRTWKWLRVWWSWPYSRHRHPRSFSRCSSRKVNCPTRRYFASIWKRKVTYRTKKERLKFKFLPRTRPVSILDVIVRSIVVVGTTVLVGLDFVGGVALGRRGLRALLHGRHHIGRLEVRGVGPGGASVLLLLSQLLIAMIEASLFDFNGGKSILLD